MTPIQVDIAVLLVLATTASGASRVFNCCTPINGCCETECSWSDGDSWDGGSAPEEGDRIHIQCDVGTTVVFDVSGSAGYFDVGCINLDAGTTGTMVLKHNSNKTLRTTGEGSNCEDCP